MQCLITVCAKHFITPAKRKYRKERIFEVFLNGTFSGKNNQI